MFNRKLIIVCFTLTMGLMFSSCNENNIHNKDVNFISKKGHANASRSGLAVKTVFDKTDLTSHFDFDNPTKTFILDPELTEISGLSYDAKTKSILAINDEKGFFYSLNPIDGKLISTQKFGKRGDYESIESTSKDIIIMKSNGDLFFYNNSVSDVRKVKTEFSHTNDLEGMALSHDQKSLLLACKGQSLLEQKTKKEKCIYAFDLEAEVLVKEPFLVIKDESLISMYNSDTSKSNNKKSKNKLKSFAPSGIAVHPETGDIYIISARGSILIIYNKEKQLETVILLNDKVNPQPEGICFDEQSNLYISTEGAGFSGKIFKYNPL